MLRHLLHIRLKLWQRKLTPEVGLYRRWLNELIEEYQK